MSVEKKHPHLFLLFARLLSYPTPALAALAAEGATELAKAAPDAVEPLEACFHQLAQMSLARQEELYTATFDLQPRCHPYIGYQLCGENQQRGLFLMKLKELYGRHGFVCGTELADHLAEVLRFLGQVDDPVCRQELVTDGVLPALEKMLGEINNAENPYVPALKALQCFLKATCEPLAADGAKGV